MQGLQLAVLKSINCSNTFSYILYFKLHYCMFMHFVLGDYTLASPNYEAATVIIVADAN